MTENTLTDTEREALVVAERRGSVRLTVERIVASHVEAAVAAALAPIEAALSTMASKHAASLHTAAGDPRAPDFEADWLALCDTVRRAALAGGGDRG